MADRVAALWLDSWPLYRALVGIATLCAVLIVVAYGLTRPVIDSKRAAALAAAVAQVLPATAHQRALVWSDERQRFEPMDRNVVSLPNVVVCLDAQQQLVGFAITAAGSGYQDRIELLYGFEPKTQAIVGMVILASRETPGLGDRIVSDPKFHDNFRQLDVALNTAGDGLRHLPQWVSAGSKLQAWQIDGISGATVSSQAVSRIIAASVQLWLPRLMRQRESLAHATYVP